MKATFIYTINDGKKKREVPVEIEVPRHMQAELRELAERKRFNQMLNQSNVGKSDE